MNSRSSAARQHLSLVSGAGEAAPPSRRHAPGRGTVWPVNTDEAMSDVMLRVAKGDEQAFAELYDAVASTVHGISRRVVRDPAQAEEVTQEVMLEVWRKAARYTPAAGSVRAWVATIAHRRSVDRVRAAQAATDRDLAAGTTGSMAPSTPYDEVAEAVESHLETERVRVALGELTELQRESIVLAYYGGHTQTDVAALLGVPLGTVKTRMRDGLIRLRDALGVDLSTAEGVRQ
jgi:RNA polymerase sigma-70 factor (ECF subfamily)